MAGPPRLGEQVTPPREEGSYLNENGMHFTIRLSGIESGRWKEEIGRWDRFTIRLRGNEWREGTRASLFSYAGHCSRRYLWEVTDRSVRPPGRCGSLG